MRSRTILFFLFLAFRCLAQDTALQTKISYYKSKAQSYLDHEKRLSGYYSIDSSGIKMYASPGDKSANKAEFSVTWNDLELLRKQLKTAAPAVAIAIYKSGMYDRNLPHVLSNQQTLIAQLSSDKPLSGYRIALDAGHIANDFETGHLERKSLKLKTTADGKKDSLEIAEGMLTYATITLLKQKLEAAGAKTFVTRVNGQSAFGKSYEQWKKQDLPRVLDSLVDANRIGVKQKTNYLDPKTPDRTIFWNVFKDLELAKRAELINAYQPDFTVIAHYNVDENNIGWNKPTEKDMDMTFVGGSFMPGDLSSEEKRFEFFRLLITDDLEQSIALSGCVVNSFEATLKVPTARLSDAKYLLEGCLPTKATGVFCRNLQLTRYIHSPLVYGETLFQDNVNESKALSKESDKTKNERVQQVAEAYYQGVLQYVKTKK